MGLLPAFFALTGLRTEIGLVSTAREWIACLAIILVATAGKFGGAALAGRLMGMPWRFAAQLGALMNTRGLMELVVLNVGLDAGLISPTVFTMMVIMALVTTAMTTPMLDLAEQRKQDQQETERRRDAGPDANRDGLADRRSAVERHPRQLIQPNLHRRLRHARVLLHEDGFRRCFHERAAERRAVRALDAHPAPGGQALDVVGEHGVVLDGRRRRLRDPWSRSRGTSGGDQRATDYATASVCLNISSPLTLEIHARIQIDAEPDPEQHFVEALPEHDARIAGEERAPGQVGLEAGFGEGPRDRAVLGSSVRAGAICVEICVVLSKTMVGW